MFCFVVVWPLCGTLGLIFGHKCPNRPFLRMERMRYRSMPSKTGTARVASIDL